MGSSANWRVMEFLQRLLPVVGLLLAGTLSAGAQAGGGSLTGTISDPGGAVIPRASLTLTNNASGTKYSTVTNSDGRYVFPQLVVGSYELRISAPGFRDQVEAGIVISIGNTATVNSTLAVGQATQQVTVTANAQQMQTETSDIGTVVSPALIQQLPLSFSGLVRSPLQFMTLTPGFEGDASGNPQSQASFKLNGGGTGSADVLLDGSSISLASPNYQWNFGVSVEAITEFNVQTSTFAAEYGRTGGGFVNVATRAGTDQFHGGVYDLLKNKVFDANSWQNNHLGNAKPTDTQNDFGGFGGGPVFIPKIYDGRGKTTWFFAYEGFRYVSVAHNTTSIPTPTMWQNGDFSALLPTQTFAGVTYPGRQIYDYTTCSGANLGNACQPFPNNQIPVSRLDPLAKSYIPLIPTPTITTQPYLNTNYSLSAPVNNDLYSLRVDQNIGKSHKLYGSYSQADMPVIDIYSLGPLLTNNFGSTTTHYARLVEDWTITPNLLNHLNFGYTRRFRIEQGPNGVGQWEGKLDWHGDFEDILIPNMGIQYDPYLGNVPTPPGDNGHFVDNSYEFDEALTWNKGRHTWQFGGGHRRQEFNAYYFSNAAADFSFDNDLTSAGNNASGNPIDPNSGSGAASFFLGAATNGTVGGPQVAGMRARYWDMYAQDDWKVNQKITMNLGLRYEIPEPVVESQCRTSQVNPTLPNPGADNLPGAMEFQGHGQGRDGRCSPMNQYWGAWGPRAGAAYQLNNNTVIRAAYGIYYTALKVSNFANTDSAGFFAPGYKWPANPNEQTPGVIPSQVPAYPGVPPPIISPTALNGLNGGGGAATGGPVFLPSRLARPGAVQNWTLDVQRQLPGQWLVDVAYVGNHGAHLQSLLKDPNVGPVSALSYGSCLTVLVTQQTTNPACAGKPVVPIPYTNFLNDFGTAATVAQALRPFPQYQTEDLDTSFSANPWGNYTYNAAQVQITKRYGAGLTILANYTWSKNLTDADSDYAPQEAWNGGSPAGLYNPADPKDEKSYSEFDQPQNVKIAYTYDLPFGLKRAHLNQSRLLDLVAGGWTLGGIESYSTGYPLFVTESNWTSGIFAGAATGAQNRPNMVPGVSISGFHGGKYIFGQSRKVNPAAFTQAPNYTFGNAPRLLGGARNFAHKEEDLQMGKAFPLITEKLLLNFRFDAFNLFNRHSYGCLDNIVGDPGFGEFTCGTGPNAEVNNNISTAIPSSRRLQANFRLTF